MYFYNQMEQMRFISGTEKLMCLTTGLCYRKQMKEGLGNLDHNGKQKEDSSHHLAVHATHSVSTHLCQLHTSYETNPESFASHLPS